jgi:RHS repeat-associated protein
MELDNEVKGNGNSYTTEFRQYDPRVGRWLSLDPLMDMFPDISPYVAFDNNPVFFIDPYGLYSEGGNECDDGKVKGKEDDFLSSCEPVNVTGQKSCASNEFKDWLNDKGGADAIRTLTNLNYNQKIKSNNSMASIIYGNDAQGNAYYPDELREKYRKEAENEAINSLKAAFAMEKSKVDPTSFSYMLNPLRRAQYMYWRALAVSSRGEGTSLASEVAFDCTLSWLSSRGLSIVKSNINIRIGRLAYKAEVRGLKEVVQEMKLAKCSSEEIARTVHQMRRQIGIEYKNLTDPDLLDAITKRNIRKYKDPLGPTIEYLRDKKKYSWDKIIQKSCTPGGADLGL